MTPEITRQPGIPAYEYPRHVERVLGRPKYSHSFTRPDYRVATGLTVRRPWWLWPLWLGVCLAIGAAFAVAV